MKQESTSPDTTQTDDRVPIERLLATEHQLFLRLPDNQLGSDLRSVVLEVLRFRASEGINNVGP
jgi:hypothetical protein